MKKSNRILVPVVILVVVLTVFFSFFAINDNKTSHTMMFFKDGKAQDIFKYTSGNKKEYNNTDSRIIRFCVYVETENDTDGDGKCDLVKTFVQVPRAAVENKYKAPVIYEADPTLAGVTKREYPGDKRIDESSSEIIIDGSSAEKLLAENNKKTAVRKSAGRMNTMQLAETQDVKEWRFKNPLTGENVYKNRQLYDYFLVRGFAVVQCAGLGTIGSEGFSTCGTKYEAEAFSNVIEWLNGKRTAYSDRESNLEVKADWTNGQVGMIGNDYGGAVQMEVASTGVEGLETVAPVSGIASWYDYSNSQGISTRIDPSYSSRKALNCASRCAEETDHSKYSSEYYNYLNTLTIEELEANGDYARPWKDRDYTKLTSKIQIPALIFQGLNNEDVNTKQMQHMFNAFTQNRQETKVILCQNAKDTLIDGKKKYELMVGNELYEGLLNRWFSHYLCDVDNGAELMPQVTWQSNIDGKFHYFESWDSYADKVLVLSKANKADTEKSLMLQAKVKKFNKNEEKKALKKGKKINEAVQRSTDLTYINTKKLPKDIDEWDASVYLSDTSDSLASYDFKVNEDFIIKGGITVNLLIKLKNVSDKYGGQMISAYLIDSSDKAFDAYETNEENGKMPHQTVSYAEDGEGVYTGSGLRRYNIDELKMSKVTDKVIARGWMDLLNPDADDLPKNSKKAEKKLKKNDVFNYSIHLTPNLYKVKKGHTLKLVVFGFDLGIFKNDRDAIENGGIDVAEEFYEKINKNYSFVIDNELSSVVIPKNTSRPIWENNYMAAWHLPEDIQNEKLDRKGGLKK